MPDFLNKISDQITRFWNKFNGKQKIQIISVLVIAIVFSKVIKSNKDGSICSWIRT